MNGWETAGKVSGYRYLIKNIGLLALGSFATKLLSFFLVPLYTNVLTTSEYGAYDMFSTTIGVLIPILTLNIQDALIRFSMEEQYDRDALVTVSMRYVLSGTAIVLVGLGVNYLFGFSENIREYTIFFLLMYMTQTLSGIVLAYIRGTDKIALLSVSSVLASLVTILCNVVFLLVFRWGLIGYFLANIIGPLLQCLYLILASGMHKHICLGRNFAAEKEEMLRYSKPFIANSLAWWVNNASDKYVVIYFCGLSENGIYSVASKIPSILNVFQSIFAQAWTLSAVKDFDENDSSGFFSNTYRTYNCGMVLLCSLIILADKILARILYAKEFYAAWRYVPWLTIAVVFGSLAGYIGGIFSAKKDSTIFARSTVIGAVSNLILNFILTPFMGPLGAAIATTVTYFVVWLLRYVRSRQYIKMNINLKRDCASYVVLVVQSVILLLVEDAVMMYALEGVCFAVVVAMYVGELGKVVRKSAKGIKGSMT